LPAPLREKWGTFIRSFLSFGGDGKVNLDTFARIPSEHGASECLVIGMGEYCQKDARLLLRHR
jgi:hypothetical protein